MALSKARQLRTAFKVLAKLALSDFHGEVHVLFRAGVPYQTRTIRPQQLDKDDEVDGVDEAALARLLAGED